MATFRPRHISRYIDRLLCGELVAEMDALCIGLLIRARYHLYTIESGFSQECAKQCYPSSWVGRSDAKFENNGLLLSIDANAVGDTLTPIATAKGSTAPQHGLMPPSCSSFCELAVPRDGGLLTFIVHWPPQPAAYSAEQPPPPAAEGRLSPPRRATYG